jgi:C4-dicarboxylate-binding protein DctP
MINSISRKALGKLTAGMLASAMALMAHLAVAAEYTMKISIDDAPLPPGVENFYQTGLRNFEPDLEELSGGRIDVQIFWNGQLGKVENVINLVRNGQVEGVIASDGHVAPYYPDIQVLGLPYLFLEREVAYEVFDGEFGSYLADKMADESGLRPMPWLENGGYRHYSSNTPIESVEDMAGMKIRTMNNPLHMQIVELLGASPTPIPWADLYTSLQTGVVEGQENSLSTFRVPKLEEVQKHIILDGHVYSILTLLISEQWLDSLPEDLQDAVAQAAENYKASNRAISQKGEMADRAYLESVGVTIFDPSTEAKAEFQDRTQGPALESIRGNVDADLLDRLLTAVEAAEANL